MSWSWWLSLALLACRGDTPGSPGSPRTQTPGTDTAEVAHHDTASHTGSVGTGAPDRPHTVAARCETTGQGQVFRCVLERSEASPASLTMTAAGAPTRSFTSASVSVEHEIWAWGLRPDTTYHWTAEDDIEGELTTHALPPDIQDLEVTVTGSLFGVDGVLVFVKCGYFVILDGEGRVLWWMANDVYSSWVDGMRWLPESRSLLVLQDAAMFSFDTPAVQEVHISGDELLFLDENQLGLRTTHDLDRWGDYTYVLGETDGGLGGFEVFDGPTHLGTWWLDAGLPGVVDLHTAHVNGLTVAEDGEVVISELTLNAIFGVDGDPSSPTFLQMQWQANGAPGGHSDLPAPDYAPADGQVWRAQHNASRVEDELWVFDNASQPTSRAVVVAMDHASGVLTEQRSWSLERSCRNQGGALEMPGGALLTCANTDKVYAFADEQTDPAWTLLATCGGDSPGASSTRAYPVVIQ